MNTKEAYRPVTTVEGVVKQNDLNFIRFILPGEDYHLEVLKNEGDYMNAMDLGSKLPKGYAFVRLSTESEIAGKFGVDLKKLEREGTNSPVHISGDIPPSIPEAGLISPELQTDGETKPNPAVFREQPQEKAGNSRRTYFKETIRVERSVPKTDNQDSLGYFKALNLNASDLEGLSDEDATRKIKSGYRAAASIAHPDHGGNNDAMVKVNRAMEVISNPSLRGAYRHQIGQFAPQTRP